MEKQALKIAIIGYGKMGKELEKVALERGHEVSLVIDNESDWEAKSADLCHCDVAIEFSMPSTAARNISRCFDIGIPVICGTTGWYDALDELTAQTYERGGCLIYSSNFSISVNIFFSLNRHLARLMNAYPEFEVEIEEIHHVTKIDAPSGTAIVLANDIVRHMDRKENWKESEQAGSSELAITSKREPNVPGTHIVTYESPNDAIEIKHTAKNRRPFALGALLACEWAPGKRGIFQMADVLSIVE